MFCVCTCVALGEFVGRLCTYGYRRKDRHGKENSVNTLKKINKTHTHTAVSWHLRFIPRDGNTLIVKPGWVRTLNSWHSSGHYWR